MKRATTLRVHAAATLLAVAALASPQAAPEPAQVAGSTAARPAEAPIPSLRGVLGMKNWFNANQGRVRVVFLLSPT